jgi:hypothetical protein
MASVERVVILLQGCIFDACGSYHIMSKAADLGVSPKYDSIVIFFSNLGQIFKRVW